MRISREGMDDEVLVELRSQGMALLDPIWTTREGLMVYVSQMDDKHLMNTIRMLRGKSPIGTTFRCDSVTRRNWINTMANEVYKRGLKVDALDVNDPIHE